MTAMDKIAIKNGRRTFANGTNDREAYPKRWIAVLVQVNCERSTAKKLSNAGFETYVPTQQEIHLWSTQAWRTRQGV